MVILLLDRCQLPCFNCFLHLAQHLAQHLTQHLTLLTWHRGAVLDSPGWSGNSALHSAAHHGRTEVAAPSLHSSPSYSQLFSSSSTRW